MSSTMRSLDTRFWSDGWVRTLTLEQKFAFIYFLTNDHSSWCGVYELGLDIAAFEMGIEQDNLTKNILPALFPKIKHVFGWIAIDNFQKYHANTSEQTLKGIENAWKTVPFRIRKELKKKTPPIGGMVGVSPSSSASSSALASSPICVSDETRLVDSMLFPHKKKQV